MNASIVIDREYGSGGREVARLLAEKLQIPMYDGPRLVDAAAEFGYDESLVADYDEAGVGGSLSERLAPRYSPDGRIIDRPYLAYEERRKLFLKLSRTGPCVFLGRCADEALRGKESFFSVFIYASKMQEREERARSVDEIEDGRIAAYIQKKDNQRRHYYHAFTGREWGAKENYDICLNTSALGYERAAECLAELWKSL